VVSVDAEKKRTFLTISGQPFACWLRAQFVTQQAALSA